MNFISQQTPAAFAMIKGSEKFKDIYGSVTFTPVAQGILVIAQVDNLPVEPEECTEKFFGFHLHKGESCTGNEQDDFADTLSHFDKDDCPHPEHSGDFPPLLCTLNGYAYSRFITDSFTINDIIGKTVVIHRNPDDFTSQPAGNSGDKIACGVILALI